MKALPGYVKVKARYLIRQRMDRSIGGTDVTVILPHSQNPSDMGIPFSYSPGTRDEPLRTFAWEATSHIALAIWVRVRVTGDAHM